jgi:hypothetical protein
MPYKDKEKARAAKAKHYAAHKEQKRARDRAYYAAHKEQKRAACAKWHATHREHCRAFNRRWKLKREYGISPEDFSRMLAAQNGRCAICRAPTPGANGAFRIDHDHATGKVRGLLCHGCNVALGLFKESPRVLDEAAKYLRRAPGGWINYEKDC